MDGENGGVVNVLIGFRKQRKRCVVEFRFGFVGLVQFFAVEDFVDFFADTVFQLASRFFGIGDDEDFLERRPEADELCDHQLDGVCLAGTCRGFNEKAFGRVEFTEAKVFHDYTFLFFVTLRASLGLAFTGSFIVICMSDCIFSVASFH